MSVSKYKDGTGITQRDRVEFSGDLTDADLIEWKKCNRGEVDYITEIEARAKAILNSGGDTTADSVQSPEWYAEQALMYIGWMRGSVNRGAIDSALSYAVQAGLVWKEAEMKFCWEGDVLTRHAQRETRRENLVKGVDAMRRDAEHEAWRVEDRRLQKVRTQNVRAMPQKKADRARAVKKSLELPETVDAISRRLE